MQIAKLHSPSGKGVEAAKLLSTSSPVSKLTIIGDHPPVYRLRMQLAAAQTLASSYYQGDWKRTQAKG